MNKAELKAITMIANKMNWQTKPVCEVVESIKQMVMNQQALELDTVGDYDGSEETLLSIALWDTDKISSCLFCSDFTSMVAWSFFCLSMGMNSKDGYDLVQWERNKDAILAESWLAEEDYYKEEEALWQMEYDDYCYGVYMGWY